MYIYYVLIDEVLNYLETETEQTAEDFKIQFESFDNKIEVFENCCNHGPLDLIYKNY